MRGRVQVISQHARQRYWERVKMNASDNEIVRNAIYGLPGYVFEWTADKTDPTRREVLKTVLYEEGVC